MRSTSLSVRFFLAFLVLQAITIALAIAAATAEDPDHYSQLLARQLVVIAEDAAGRLDGDALARVIASRDAASEDYRGLRAELIAVRDRYQLGSDVYTLHRDGASTFFGISCRDQPLLGQRYDLRPEMGPALSGEGPSTTRAYRDAHGWWISAYAPVRDRAGHVVGILEADFDLQPHVTETRERTLRAVAASSGLALVVSGLLAAFFARWLLRPLRELAAVAEKVSMGELDVRVPDRAPGEVGQLARSFERAIVATRWFKERLEHAQQTPKDAPPGQRAESEGPEAGGAAPARPDGNEP